MSEKIVIDKINELKKEIKPLVDARLSDFKKVIEKKDEDLFREFCFCIIVANNSIENGLRAFNNITSREFLTLELDLLKEKLRTTARRFYNKRAEYIFHNRQHKDKLIGFIRELQDRDFKKLKIEDGGLKVENAKDKTEKLKNKKQIQDLNLEYEIEVRNWLAENIKGFGLKEASHFLRNIGFFNFAILDRHILKFLYKHGILPEVPKTLTKSRYLEIEKILMDFGKKLNLNMAELDVYLFYIDSGRICEK